MTRHNTCWIIAVFLTSIVSASRGEPLAGPWYTGANGNPTPSLSDPNADGFDWGFTQSAAQSSFWTYFPVLSLEEDGDEITISFNIEFLDPPGGVFDAMRFGLFNDGGTRDEVDLPNSNSSVGFKESLGYFATWPTDGGTRLVHLWERGIGANNPISTFRGTPVDLGSIGGTTVKSANVPYFVSFTIHRITENQFEVFSSFGNDFFSVETMNIYGGGSFNFFYLGNTQPDVHQMRFTGFDVRHTVAPPAGQAVITSFTRDAQSGRLDVDFSSTPGDLYVVEEAMSIEADTWTALGDGAVLAAAAPRIETGIEFDEVPEDEVASYRIRRTRTGGPNVLFLAIDDLRPQLNAFGESQMITPNIDRLASQGRIFSRHYSQCPTCGAARYALMTSLRPSTAAESSNFVIEALLPDTNNPIHPNSLPQAFRFAGYRTVSLGKLSHNPDGNRPNGQPEMPNAWDENYMTSGQWGTAWDAFFGYAGGDTRVAGVSPRSEIGTNEFGVSLLDTDYPDGLMAEEAVLRLQEFATTGERFFFGVGFFKPHLPYCAPKAYWDLYDRESLIVPPNVLPSGIDTSLTFSGNGEFFGNYGGPNATDTDEAKKMIHAYYACVSYIDAQVGKVLDELDALGLSDDTVVVLWGDHGYHLGEHRMWGKQSTLEEALRSPLIIRTPGMPDPGVASDSIVESVGIYPTLTALCGIPTPNGLKGVSFAHVLDDPTAGCEAVGLSYWNKDGIDGFSVRNDRYRLVRWGNPAAPMQIDLFDYLTDPTGSQNVAAAHPEIVAGLVHQIDLLIW
jgi:arylsulfatase A-like enzyme